MGSEDLTVYLGEENDIIQKEKLNFNSPAAIAHRISYDPMKTWGKGLIWLAYPGSIDSERFTPDYYDSTILYAILLHEVGHIFGNTHVSHTIMRDDLTNYTYRGSKPVITIDQGFELAKCPDCTKTYDGIFNLSYRHEMEDPDETAAAFALLMNRPLSGTPKVSLTVVNSYDNGKRAKVLHLSDRRGQKDFKISIGDYDRVPKSSGQAFKVYFPNPDWDYLNRGSFLAQPHIEYGELKTLGGKEITTVLNYNMPNDTCGNSFIVLSAISKGHKLGLFRLPVQKGLACTGN